MVRQRVVLWVASLEGCASDRALPENACKTQEVQYVNSACQFCSK